MKLRQGRKNPLNLYIQLGEQPSDADPCLGLVVDQHAAACLVRLVNEAPQRRLDVLLDAAAAQLGID